MPRYRNNEIFEEWQSSIIGITDPVELFKFVEGLNRAAITKSGKGNPNLLGKKFLTFIRRCFVIEYRLNQGFHEKEVSNILSISVKSVKNDMEWYRGRRNAILSDDIKEDERRFLAMWMIFIKSWKENY